MRTNMALPNNIEARTKDEWLKLANNGSDPMARKPVTDALRALGVQPTEYMSWDGAARVEFIMKAQGEGAEEKAPEAKASGKKDAVAPSGGGASLDAATKAAIKETLETAKAVKNLLVVLCLSIPAAKSNAEDMGIELKLGND